ncbi:MAG: helix-turn-helix domain-containing protein [candidate division KSB1 bacterium]|nr:helix-turn-helix domain-containing protein [candidate division KSB1 bacterium]
MTNTDKLKSFDAWRPEFKPYGFTVEVWTPKVMPRADRHNEIEINLLTGGSLTYLINDRRIRIPDRQLAVFWALIPHQIVHFDHQDSYFVCTIPFAQFMEWQLPGHFVEQILGGDVVISGDTGSCSYDQHLFETWQKDINGGDSKYRKVLMLEIRARLNRFAINSVRAESMNSATSEHKTFLLDLVEKMIVFIARNYTQSIKNEDIARAVGLHPDYANSVFKKSFGTTLNAWVLQQRILHAQRELSVSQKSITEIAYEAGFNSLSRFNAAFRKKCNCSPREYRNRYRSVSG